MNIIFTYGSPICPFIDGERDHHNSTEYPMAYTSIRCPNNGRGNVLSDRIRILVHPGAGEHEISINISMATYGCLW